MIHVNIRHFDFSFFNKKFILVLANIDIFLFWFVVFI